MSSIERNLAKGLVYKLLILFLVSSEKIFISWHCPFNKQFEEMWCYSCLFWLASILMLTLTCIPYAPNIFWGIFLWKNNWNWHNLHFHDDTGSGGGRLGEGGRGEGLKSDCIQTSKVIKEFSKNMTGGSKVLKFRILFAIFTVGIGYSRQGFFTF